MVARSGEELSDDQRHTVFVVITTGCAFSVLGSTTILLCFLLIPKLRRFAFRLVAYLSISDLFSSISLLLGDPKPNSAMCTAQAVLSQYFSLASVFWTGSIALVLYKAVVRRKMVVSKLEKTLHLMVWGGAGLLTFIPWVSGAMGKVWATVIVTGVLYFFVGKTLKRTKALLALAGLENGESSNSIKLVQRLGLYPLILAAVWIMPTVNRIQNWASPHNPVMALFILSGLTLSLQGLANATAYGVNRTVRQAVFDAVKTGFGIFGGGSKFMSEDDDGLDVDDDDVDFHKEASTEDIALTESQIESSSAYH